ncbi:MAG: glycosyltransferase family 2 protein [Pararhodobacter sp.]
MQGAVPAISVIVPVFDIADHVAACLESLIDQTEPDFEVLVIDDGATDGSGEIARATIAGDPRFRVIRQDNRGLSGARNTGLALARAPLVAFLDGDDRFAPDFLYRMRQTLAQTGADWAACAIRFCFPDGQGQDHPAIHGAVPADDAAPRSLPLDDCMRIVDHFPSAWNKLYRRDLIGDLRFVEGTWFEDHEWFWALASRTDRIAYLPQPLYLHSRDRPGQITAADDERGFQQFAVLDRLAPLFRGIGRPNAQPAFLRLSRRLIHERGLALRSPARRARFLAAGRAYLAAQPDSQATPPGSGTVGDDAPALAVAVIDRGDDQALAATLAALRLQTLPDMTVTVIGRTWASEGLPLMSVDTPLEDFLVATDSRYLALLQAGDQPAPDAFLHLINGMDLHGVPFGMAGFNRVPQDWAGAGQQTGYHDGWCDNRVAGADLHQTDFAGAPRPISAAQALRLHGSGAARVIARPLLAGIAPLSVPLSHPLALAELALRAACAAPAMFFTPLPLAQVPAVAPGGYMAPAAITGWARRLGGADTAALPQSWRAVLAARLLQDQMDAIARPVPRWLYLLRAGLSMRWAGLRDGAPGVADPHIRWPVRAALGVARAAR